MSFIDKVTNQNVNDLYVLKWHWFKRIKMFLISLKCQQLTLFMEITLTRCIHGDNSSIANQFPQRVRLATGTYVCACSLDGAVRRASSVHGGRTGCGCERCRCRGQWCWMRPAQGRRWSRKHDMRRLMYLVLLLPCWKIPLRTWGVAESLKTSGCVLIRTLLLQWACNNWLHTLWAGLKC